MRRSDRCYIKFSDEPTGSLSCQGGIQEAAGIHGLGPWGCLPLPSGHKGPWCWQRSQSDFTGPTDKGRALFSERPRGLCPWQDVGAHVPLLPQPLSLRAVVLAGALSLAGDLGQMETFLVTTTGGVGAGQGAASNCVDIRGAAKHPTMHRTAPLQQGIIQPQGQVLGLRNPDRGQAGSSHSHVISGEGVQTGALASLLYRLKEGGRNRLKGGRSLSRDFQCE